MTWIVSYRRVGNPYRSWIVGCDECGRRLHIDRYGAMRTHNKAKGEECPGSRAISEESRARMAEAAGRR